MPVYMADREVPGMTMEQLAGAQRAAIEKSGEFTASGQPIRYIRSMYVPSEAHLMCLFEAQDAATVKAVNDAAGLPYKRIVEASDLTPA